MRKALLVIVAAVLVACSGPTTPVCYAPGDTVGWVIQYKDGKVTRRDPIPATKAFCL